MDRIDLSVPANSAGDGSRLGAHLAVPVARCRFAFPAPGSRRADGVHELHHAFRHLHAHLLRLWAELLRGAGVLSDLLRCSWHLDRAVDREPAVAATLPLRPAGVAVAESDLLESAAADGLRTVRSCNCSS